MRPRSKKAKYTCRRCKQDYERTFEKQRVCGECRLKCSKCGSTLVDNAYSTRPTSWCKECCRKNVQQTKGNKGFCQKTYDYKRHYGISLEDAEVLLSNGCAICGDTERLHIDHCHTTGKVRAALCGNCNSGLGMFKENTDLLLKATEYLTYHASKK